MLLTLPFATLLPSELVEILYRAEWAPGKHPLDPPADGDWTPLLKGTKSRLHEWSSSSGRQDDLNAFEPLSATLILDGTDGELDESDATSLVAAGGSGLSYTPIRVSASLDRGATYLPIFSGFIDENGWTPIGPAGHEQHRVRVDVTDWFGWAASHEMPASRFGYWAASEDPTAWITGETTNKVLSPSFPTNYAFDEGQQVDQFQLVGTVSSFNATDSLVPGDSGDALTHLISLARATSVISLPVLLIPEATAEWSLCGFFKAPTAIVSGSVYLVWGDDGSGNKWWSVSLAAGSLIARIWDGAGSILGSAVISVDHADNATHFFRAWWSTTLQKLRISSDLGDSGSTNYTGDAPGPGGFLVIGNDSSATYGTNLTSDDFVYFERKVPRDDRPLRLSWIEGNEDRIVADTDFIGYAPYDEAVAFVMDAARIPVPDYIVDQGTGEPSDSGYLYAGATPNWTASADLAGAMVELAGAVNGAVYVRRDGAIQWRDMNALSTLAKYTGIIATISDAAAPPGIAASARSRSGRRIDRVINSVTVGEGVAFPPWTQRDAASITRYGKRHQTLNNRGYYDTGGAEIATDILDRYATPPIEIGDIDIVVNVDVAPAIFAVKDLELEVPLRYVESQGGSVLVDETVRVQHIAWSAPADGPVVVTIAVAPA